ncbi:MAG TPA: alanine racemase [Dongiaceae bacterium]|nr:alanine racemase [Dongiaceae bacterium]
MTPLPFELHRPTWAEIDLDRLAANLGAVRARLSGPGVMAVVKADAYGHGALPVARRLEREAIEWLGVALVEEGVELRRGGVRAPILVLGGFAPAQAPLLLAENLTPTLFRLEQIEALERAAAARGANVDAHLKIDTGMGRLGMPIMGLPGLCDALARAPHVRLGGACSHLAAADDPADPYSAAQLQEFLRGVNLLRGRGHAPEHLHLANSAAIVDHRATGLTLVRPGLLLYGYNASPRTALAVRPILALRTHLIDLRELPEGASVGYGRAWKSPGLSTVATLGIGYADGLPRAAGNRGEVLVRGRRAPIVGRVSMDMTTIAVSAIPDAAVGDVATVIGRDDGEAIGADALALAAGSIVWEVLARLGSRVPRLYGEGETRSLATRFAAPPSPDPGGAL